MHKQQMKMLANAIDKSLSNQRMALLNAGNGNIDSKHHRLWEEFGYINILEFHSYHDAYERNSMANAAVHVTLDETWQDYPNITDGNDESAFTKACDGLFKPLWAKFKDADRRNMVGRYSALLIQYKDSVSDDKRVWDSEVNEVVLARLKTNAIKRLIPCWEGQLTACNWDSDEQSENYGEVTKYQYNEGAVGDHDQPRTFMVHPDRVIILSEGNEDGCLTSGIPLLRAGFNNLTNLQKVAGGTAESYFKNAARQIVYQMGQETDLEELRDALKKDDNDESTLADLINDLIVNLNTGFDSAAMVKDGDVKALQGEVPDPKSSWEINAQEFAGSVRVPMRRLVGSEEGKMAGEQDGQSFSKRCMSRRLWLSGVVERQVKQWMEYGILPPVNDFDVEWSDLLEPSLMDKLDIVKKMLECNDLATKSGMMELIFTADEARDVADYDRLSEVEKGSPDPKVPPEPKATVE